MNTNRIVALALCGAVAMGAVGLFGCSTNTASTASSATASSGASSSAAKPAFFSIDLPEGWTQDADPYVYHNNAGGTIYVAVNNMSADNLINSETFETDYAETDSVEVGGIVYRVVSSDKSTTAFWIAEWEDGCLEVTVENVGDAESVKSFLSGLHIDSGAYAKWQQSVSSSE